MKHRLQILTLIICCNFIIQVTASPIALSAEISEGSTSSAEEEEQQLTSQKIAEGESVGEEELQETSSGQLAVSPSKQRMGDLAELERIRALYTAGEYQRCSAELQGFLGLSTDSNLEPFSEDSVIEQAHLYLATCSLLAGQDKVARQSLKTALEKNPLMLAPDSMSFPPPLIRLFSDVRAEVELLVAQREEQELAQQLDRQELFIAKKEANLAREQELRRLASELVVIAKSSRIIAFLPFGAGQYQNGRQGLGHFFLVSEVAAASVTFGAWLALEGLNQKYQQYGTATSGLQLVPEDFNRKKSLALTTLTVAGWSWLGLTLAGIAEAQIRFVPERRLEVRQRSLPPELKSPLTQDVAQRTNTQLPPEQPYGRITSGQHKKESVAMIPLMSPMPGGVYLGLAGQF